MEDTILRGLGYALPAIVTGGVAYYFFSSFLKHNIAAKNIELLVAKKKESLPIKLQAYERLLLFCERINPTKLLLRVKPIGEDSQHYLKLLIANIEQEFEHNLVQQIYISTDSWTAIIAAKTTLINRLKQTAETAKNSTEFREQALLDYSTVIPPTDTAIAFIKNEVKKLLH